METIPVEPECHYQIVLSLVVEVEVVCYNLSSIGYQKVVEKWLARFDPNICTYIQILQDLHINKKKSL